MAYFSVLQNKLSPTRKRVSHLPDVNNKERNEWAERKRKQLLDDKVAELERESEERFSCSKLWKPLTRRDFAGRGRVEGCQGDYCDIFVTGETLSDHAGTFTAKLPEETVFYVVSMGSITKDHYEMGMAIKRHKEKQQLLEAENRAKAEAAVKAKWGLLSWDSSPAESRQPTAKGKTKPGKKTPAKSTKNNVQFSAQLQHIGVKPRDVMLRATWAGHELPDIHKKPLPFHLNSPIRERAWRTYGEQVVQYDQALVCENCYRVYLVLDEERKAKDERKWIESCLSRSWRPSQSLPPGWASPKKRSPSSPPRANRSGQQSRSVSRPASRHRKSSASPQISIDWRKQDWKDELMHEPRPASSIDDGPVQRSLSFTAEEDEGPDVMMRRTVARLGLSMTPEGLLIDTPPHSPRSYSSSSSSR
mmetsp:Transcript_35103/g.80055  ORF Transcript_35103/g.80055 Transcript_35103/m.80055 type:complete len:418 (+) Transcript_35103:27-1280(+)